MRRSELYHHEEQETPPGAHGGNEVLPETPALYPAPRSTLSAGTEPLCGKKAAQGLLFFPFLFPGARGPAPGQTNVAGEDINCRCFLTYRMEKKKWGLGATIGDPEAGVPLHEEPKRIKSIPVWDVRAIEKSWMLLTRRL